MNAHNTPLRTIVLHGLARKKFGPIFRMAVSSAAEAVRALDQLPGFRQFVEQHNFRVVCGPSPRAGLVLDKGLVDFNLPTGDLHFVPVLRGSKRGGIGKIIAGVLLLAVAFFVPFSSLATGPIIGTVGWGSATSIGGLAFGNVAVMSMGLIATGIAQLMAKQDKVDQAEASKNESFMLNAPANVTEQGGPVPLIYGRTMVGSTLISAGLDTVSIGIGENSDGGTAPPQTDGEPGTFKYKATGAITFNDNPVPGNAINVNGVIITFVAGTPPFNNQAEIRGTVAETVSYLRGILMASLDTRLDVLEFGTAGNVLTVAAVNPGPNGNAYTLAAVSGTMWVSGPTLTGGA